MQKYSFPSDITDKRNYIIERIKHCRDDYERKDLCRSLQTFLTMEHPGITLKKLGNIYPTPFFTTYKLSEDLLGNQLEDKSVVQPPMMNDEYLAYLLEIGRQIGKSASTEITLSKFQMSEHALTHSTHTFFRQLKEPLWEKTSEKLLNEKNHLLTFDTAQQKKIMLMDPIFDNCYQILKRKCTIEDSLLVARAVINTVEQKQKKYMTESVYPGFSNVSAYFIDHLMIDYMKKTGFPKEEVEQLEAKKDNDLRMQARYLFGSLEERLIAEKSFSDSRLTAANVKNYITTEEWSSLFDIQAQVMGRQLYNIYQDDHQFGIGLVNQLMKTKLPRDQIPDLSVLELSQMQILKTSKAMGKHSTMHTKR